jgi:hypothetical protein
MTTVKILFYLAASSWLIGCASEKSPPPPNNVIAESVAELYQHAGIGAPILAQRVLGKHYSPFHDHWTVIACVDFNASGKESTDCNDSFNLIKLDSGMWVIRGTVNGQYRWMQVKSV